IRIEALASGERQGLFDPVKPVEPPALTEDDRIGGHLGVLGDFLAAVRSGVQPETAGRDNIRSLAMVFGAIESAEAQRRVGIDA
ncbi:MAG TPA: gfo/Idh/MocA family oxidoreductase, partial [Roseiarcus sp.]